MEVYILRADANNYRNLTSWESHHWQTIFRKFDGRQLASSWQPVKVRMLDDESDVNLPKGDFPSLTSHVPVCSQRAYAALEDLIGSEGEFLPLLCGDEEYFAFNVTNIIDALNMTKSEVKLFRDSDRIMRILKHQFEPSKLKNANIFKLPQLPLMNVYVTGRFVKQVHESHLKGFLFKLVWSD